jgi:translation elongation factor P/translation initiation factor 5A
MQSDRVPSCQTWEGTPTTTLSLTLLTSYDTVIVIDSTSSQHSKFYSNQGGAFVRTKLRNMLTSNIIEKTFRAGENLEEADIEKISATFFFMKKEEYIFKSTEYENLHLLYLPHS